MAPEQGSSGNNVSNDMDIRQTIYTTNTIKSVNHVIRKALPLQNVPDRYGSEEMGDADTEQAFRTQAVRYRTR